MLFFLKQQKRKNITEEICTVKISGRKEAGHFGHATDLAIFSCHVFQSCPTDPITRRKRGTQSVTSSDLTKTLYTSVQLIDPEGIFEPSRWKTNNVVSDQV